MRFDFMKTPNRGILQIGIYNNSTKRAWRLAPSGPKFTRNDYDSAIRCTGQLQHTLGEAKNGSMERTHTPVRFQVALSS